MKRRRKEKESEKIYIKIAAAIKTPQIDKQLKLNRLLPELGVSLGAVKAVVAVVAITAGDTDTDVRSSDDVGIVNDLRKVKVCDVLVMAFDAPERVVD